MGEERVALMVVSLYDSRDSHYYVLKAFRAL